MINESSETTSAHATLAKEAVELIDAAVKPAITAAGNNIGKLFDGTFGWIGLLGDVQKEKQRQMLEDFKSKLESKYDAIPKERQMDPNPCTVGQILSASQFHIDSNELRDMFAQLLASASDSQYTDTLQSSFAEILKQISPLDARFLNLFRTHHTYPCMQPTEIDKDGKLTDFQFYIFDYFDQNPNFTRQEELNLIVTIDNLQRLGLIKLNSRIVQLNYDYSRLSTHPIMISCIQQLAEGSRISTQNYRVELTNYGQAFTKCCFGL